MSKKFQYFVDFQLVYYIEGQTMVKGEETSTKYLDILHPLVHCTKSRQPDGGHVDKAELNCTFRFTSTAMEDLRNKVLDLSP